MSITLTYDTTTINLPADLYWNDENQWYPVEQTIERTITGALVVSAAAKVAGRPITLQPIDDTSAWMSRAVLEQIRNLAAVPGRVMNLTLRGQSRDVIFRHQDGAGVEATPVEHYRDVVDADFYKVTLRFMEV